MDRGAWWAIVHRVSKSQAQLKWLSTICVCHQEHRERLFRKELSDLRLINCLCFMIWRNSIFLTVKNWIHCRSFLSNPQLGITQHFTFLEIKSWKIISYASDKIKPMKFFCSWKTLKYCIPPDSLWSLEDFWFEIAIQRNKTWWFIVGVIGSPLKYNCTGPLTNGFFSINTYYTITWSEINSTC